MAKGFEDTAFYRYNRLVSLNEVGGAPDRFGCSVERFHAAIARRAEDWPHAMNSTATHDSKRGEDVRARLNVLSEIPTEWKTRLEAWHTFTRGHRMRKGSKTVPDKNTEYLLYQTLIGAWPQGRPVTRRFVDRVKAYMIKAAREAGEHTSWLEPEEAYETALAGFVESILDPSPQNEFMPAFVPFCKKIAFFGLFNSLSQCLLKIAAPGIPDFYQGAELPQLALVDPDNRRPVAYDERRRLLKAIGRVPSDPLAQVAGLLENRDDGRVKLFVIARALATRRQRKDVFQSGRYLPLEASGLLAATSSLLPARPAGSGVSRWCRVFLPRWWVRTRIRSARMSGATPPSCFRPRPRVPGETFLPGNRYKGQRESLSATPCSIFPWPCFWESKHHERAIKRHSTASHQPAFRLRNR